MADSAASSQPRSSRADTSRRRSPAVSTDTENKLARAARSAQRLAQLSDASRDDSTLDLFPDDPTRATLEAMNIDIRQGTLHGFELPDVVRAALGAPADAPAAPLAPLAPAAESRSARRAARGDRTEPVRESVMLDGFERIEPSVGPTPPVSRDAGGTDVATDVAMDVAAAGATTAAIAAARADSVRATPPGAAAMSTAEAVAAVARGMHALREAATSAGERASGQPGAQPQRVAATVTRAATASREPAAPGGSAAGPAGDGLAATGLASETTTTADVPPARRRTAADRQGAPFVASAPAKDAAPGAPELDRARATAFADTVDALYGVISDQRRAATDHSRRMKAMLSIVVGALLVTVAIGIVQTALLMRLTHETAAQQQHIAQMMQDQRTAMTGLLDERLAAAMTAAASAAAAQRPVTAPPREREERRHKVQHGHARAHGAAASASAHGGRKVARAG
jgi:hypothetical protein